MKAHLAYSQLTTKIQYEELEKKNLSSFNFIAQFQIQSHTDIHILTIT